MKKAKTVAIVCSITGCVCDPPPPPMCDDPTVFSCPANCICENETCAGYMFRGNLNGLTLQGKLVLAEDQRFKFVRELQSYRLSRGTHYFLLSFACSDHQWEIITEVDGETYIETSDIWACDAAPTLVFEASNSPTEFRICYP
jgi:hypothetical protein